MKLVPDPRTEPPVATLYQLIIPAEVVAPKVTVPLVHTFPGVVPVIEGIGFTVAVTAVLEALVHPLSVAST